MGRRRSEESLPADPVVRCLLDLALAHDGARDTHLLARQRALLDHPAIRHRIGLGASPFDALFKAIADVSGSGRFTTTELEAVSVLLSIVLNTRTPDGTLHRVRDRSHTERAGLAVQHVGHTTTASFTRGRRDGHGTWQASPEVRLLTRFKEALDALDAAESISGHLDATPPTNARLVSTDDLIGTWAGRSQSDWHLKVSPGQRSQEVRCYMVVAPSLHADLQICWFYPAGVSVSIACRVADVEGERRLVCMYEAWTGAADQGGKPSHRGACLLDVITTPTLHVQGPYWTDRRTHGVLAFDRRVSEIASSFAGAQEVFTND